MPVVRPVIARKQRAALLSTTTKESSATSRPRALQEVKRIGATAMTPMKALRVTGPMIPRWSAVDLELKRGWITLSQNPLTNPPKDPIAMQAPILLMKPAQAEMMATPPRTPTNDSLTPTRRLPNMNEEIYVVMTLAVRAKQMLRARSQRQGRVQAEEVRKREGSSVQGLEAKAKPVPMSPMKADWRDPLRPAMQPSLQLIMTEVMMEKTPANRQMNAPPFESKTSPIQPVQYSVFMYWRRQQLRGQQMLKTAVTVKVSTTPKRPTSPQRQIMSETRQVIDIANSTLLTLQIPLKSLKTYLQKMMSSGCT